MAVWKLFSAIAAVGAFTDAIPTIEYPINAQVPPVARVAEPFSYSFSASTFSSTSAITYTLSSSPGWLSLNSNTRTLSGTPSINDVGAQVVTGVPIGITASDQSGSVTLNATLVISKNPAPVISVPALSQLPSFGDFSAPSKLLYHPSTQFEINFNPSTFADPVSNFALHYYAITLQNTPLPSWISFDSSSLSFSGQTPDYYSLIEPPQIFGFQLIASDVEGFAGISISFEIEVGVHLLAFSNIYLALNATVGSNIKFTGLSNDLQLDGKVANVTSLDSITAETPPWLTFDNYTFILSGTPPVGATSYNVTICATDIYGDNANATIYIDILTTIFSEPIGGLNATIGTTFSYDFSSYLRNKSDVDMTAQFFPVASWLTFNSVTFVLFGQVPSDIRSSTINITLNAISKSSHISAAQSFGLAIISGASQVSSTSPRMTPSQTAATPGVTATNSSEITSEPVHKSLSKGTVAAIVVPIALLFMGVLIFLCLYRQRRRSTKGYLDNTSKSDISAPLEIMSSRPETTRPPRLVSRTKLHLDTTGFGMQGGFGRYTNERYGGAKRNVDGTIKRSHTFSAMSGPFTAEIRDSQSSGTRTRAYSDNVLSKTNKTDETDKSWRTTQDSPYPTIGSGTNSSTRMTCNYSNYSRKGHTRRSTRAMSSEQHVRGSNLSIKPSEPSSLDLRDNGISNEPLHSFSMGSNGSSIQQTQETVKSKEQSQRDRRSIERNSRFVPTLDQRQSGIGHGGRESILSLAGAGGQVRTIGHGQDWLSGLSGCPNQGLVRDSTTWLAMNTTDICQQNRRSTASNLTESTDLLYPGDSTHMTIKKVPKSPVPPPSAPVPEGTKISQPVSRRTVGAAYFFGGSSRERESRSSRRSPQLPKRSLHADSPTVPDASTMNNHLESTIIQNLRGYFEVPQDSFGISYGAAREGTKQLRSYIQSRLERIGSPNSIKSNQSRDSRFESAPGSAYSLNPKEREGRDEEGHHDEWREYLADDYSEGSWETQHTNRDSQGNVIEYTLEDSTEVTQVAAQAKAGSNSPARNSSFSNRSGTSHIPDIGPSARVGQGVGRRHASVDAQVYGNRKYFQVVNSSEKDELDYTVYI